MELTIKTTHTVMVMFTVVSVWSLFLLTCIYVRQDYYLKIKKRKPKWMDVFPSLEKLHRWIVFLFYMTFILLTLVVVNGFVLAHQKWGSTNWLSQPKLLAATLTWLYFFGMLLFRKWKGFRGGTFFIWLIVGCLFLCLSMYGAYAWK